MSQLRERIKSELPSADAGAGFSIIKADGNDHPSGKAKDGGLKQAVNATLFAAFMLGGMLWYVWKSI